MPPVLFRPTGGFRPSTSVTDLLQRHLVHRPSTRQGNRGIGSAITIRQRNIGANRIEALHGIEVDVLLRVHIRAMLSIEQGIHHRELKRRAPRRGWPPWW